MSENIKKLKRFSKIELIEIISQLQQNEIELLKKHKELEAKLADRSVKIEEAGSIAEASLIISDIFNTAQNTADHYLAEVREANAMSEERANKIIADAQNKADHLLATTKSSCDNMLKETEDEIRNQWSAFTSRMESITQAREELSSNVED